MMAQRGLIVLFGCGIGLVAFAGASGRYSPVPRSIATFISWDSACSIKTDGLADRWAQVIGDNTKCEDRDDVSLVSSVAYGFVGATLDKTFPPSGTISCTSCNASEANCDTWQASGDVRIHTKVKVVVDATNIDVDIETESLTTEHFMAAASRNGTGIQGTSASATYRIPKAGRNSDILAITVPFTISCSATEVRVRRNKLTRAEGGSDAFSAAGNTTSVNWWLYTESGTNCVASSTLIDTDAHDDLSLSGSETVEENIFTFDLPACDKKDPVPHDVVLVVEYKTYNLLLATATCGNSESKDATLMDGFQLTLEPGPQVEAP